MQNKEIMETKTGGKKKFFCDLDSSQPSFEQAEITSTWEYEGLPKITSLRCQNLMADQNLRIHYVHTLTTSIEHTDPRSAITEATKSSISQPKSLKKKYYEKG